MQAPLLMQAGWQWRILSGSPHCRITFHSDGTVRKVIPLPAVGLDLWDNRRTRV
nr:MAG TPA: hypothetical protein [Caudoviricetes sp.]